MKEQIPDTHEKPEIQAGRRRLLKVLAAAGGAVAVGTLLPTQWRKPGLTVGALPAHAQMSEAQIVLTDLVFERLAGNTPHTQCIILENFGGDFEYTDPLGEIDTGASLYAKVTGDAEPIYDFVPCDNPNISFLPGSTPSHGWIRFLFNRECPPGPGDPEELCVRLRAGGRTSDPLCGMFACSVPD